MADNKLKTGTESPIQDHPDEGPAKDRNINTLVDMISGMRRKLS